MTTSCYGYPTHRFSNRENFFNTIFNLLFNMVF